MKVSQILAVSGILIGLAASAASAVSIEAKSIEIDGDFSFQHTSVSVDGPGDFGVTIFTLNPTIGYFLNPRIELRGGLLIDHLSVDDNGTTDIGLTVGGDYHFPTSGDIIPYAGLALGFIGHGGDLPNNADNTEVIFPQITAGVRIPFRDIASMNAEAGYRHRSSAFGFEDTSGNDFFLGFGFTLFFRGGFVK